MATDHWGFGRNVVEVIANLVTLFTQEGCQDSARVRDCLTRSGVPFVERNVSTDLNAGEALMRTGIFATPLVVAGDRSLLVRHRSDLARQLGFTCRCPDGGGA